MPRYDCNMLSARASHLQAELTVHYRRQRIATLVLDTLLHCSRDSSHACARYRFERPDRLRGCAVFRPPRTSIFPASTTTCGPISSAPKGTHAGIAISCRLNASDSRITKLDIRDRDGVDEFFQKGRFELVVHAAAQPSHDLAAQRPFDDFDVNAVGTLNMLEACRRHSPEAVFIHMSTNKVYGDGPNHIPLKELETRWDYADPHYEHGIAEDFSIDNCLHSLFGASKVAGDVLARNTANTSA